MGWIINIVAFFLFWLVFIVDQFIRLFTKRSENSAYSNGFKLNVFANELFADTFNIIMLKKQFKEFGVFGEPLSSVFGRCYQNGKLSKFGNVIRFLIDVADIPMLIKGKSHCIEWIRTKEEIKRYKNSL